MGDFDSPDRSAPQRLLLPRVPAGRLRSRNDRRVFNDVRGHVAIHNQEAVPKGCTYSPLVVQAFSKRGDQDNRAREAGQGRRSSMTKSNADLVVVCSRIPKNVKNEEWDL